MSHHLKNSDYLETPWKNGQGSTSQIKIYPENATISELNFDWRLSIAKISSPCPFSLFPDFQRILMVWKGQGLILNQKKLNPFEVLNFSGNEKINSQLVRSTIWDLGVIFNPKKIKAEMKVIKIDEEILLKDNTSFLFCAEEYFSLDGKNILEGECLQFFGNHMVKFQGPLTAKIILVTINLLQNNQH